MSVVSNNILAGASGQGGAGYAIERSVRFNSADDAWLGKSFSSAGNRKTWTLSCWYKATLAAGRKFIFVGYAPGNVHSIVNFTTDGKFEVFRYAGGHTFQFITTSVFRDPSAWYHIVLAWDTTQATASNRIKLYINGEIVDTLDSGYTSNYPPQNGEYEWNNSSTHGISGYVNYLNAVDSADQYLADYHFIDGQALAPTDFGELDDNGVWQPKAYTFSTNPNNGTTWSNSISGTAESGWLKSQTFDGTGASSRASSGNSLTFTPSSPIPVNTSLRINARRYGSGSSQMTVNGTNYT